MTNKLSLIKNASGVEEQRILPRFPFCFLTFKVDGNSQVFEVRDVSASGMQISLKLGEVEYHHEDKIHGHLHWFGKDLEISGNIRWIEDKRMGVEFEDDSAQKIECFFDDETIMSHLKPVVGKLGIDLPPRLHSWMHCDGPVDCFVWQHGDGGVQSFQLIKFNHFLEWDERNGLRSGRVISKRHLETPLLEEDDVIFRFDLELDKEKLKVFQGLISLTKPKVLESEIAQFICLKLN